MQRTSFWLLGLTAFLAGCLETGQVLAPSADDDASKPTEGLALAASALSAGQSHACALFSGQIACWGQNDHGQLGLGDRVDRRMPVFLPFEGAFRQIAAGTQHTCALEEPGKVYCWGQNDRGQLGVGTRESSSRPTLVPLPALAAAIASSFMHACAILVNSSLWCWGQNSEGELGQGDAFPARNEAARRETDRLTPVLIAGSWQSADTGQGHTCGIQQDGSLWCWGRNSRSELGTEPLGQLREPTRVGAASDWRAVDAGQHYTCALKSDRTLWCWGENTGSESDQGFPLGIQGAVLDIPTRVGTASAWVSFSGQTFHSCALDAAFDLYCWGRNLEGQLGLGDLGLRPSPARVGSGFASVTVGRFFTCALRRDGSIGCAGENASGQLGDGQLDRSAVLGRTTLP